MDPGTELPRTESSGNVQQAVPFFLVTDMEASRRFYVEGLGFEMTNQWVVDGHLRWCWLDLGGASIMLQTLMRPPEGRLGGGVSISFMCRDALAFWREARARGLDASRPFVGNGLWVTGLNDPDGYRLEFQGPADAPEESVFEGD